MELLRRIGREAGKPVAEIRLTAVDYGGPPQGSDRDYAELLNLWRHETKESGVHVQWGVTPGPFIRQLSGVFEGGSFNEKIIALYAGMGLFKKLTYIAYNAQFARFPLREAGLQDIDRLDWPRDVLDGDIFVIEMNESVLISEDPDVISNGFLKELLSRLEEKK